jgi:hypothetical protein
MAIPVTIETEIYQGKSSRSANFGMEFSAKLARTLSSTLYDYKIEACIREYATNVTDSHNDSGKRGVAGKIHLPTDMEPWYEAEDFGLGMSEDTIYSIFTVYGKSTKEEDNTTNGNLGYGSKSAFAVGDQFTVTSIKDGIKTVVVCYKDRTGLPTADTKSVTTTTTETNGTKIRVPVNPKDIRNWHECGARVLGAFETLHDVNTFGIFHNEYEATVKLCSRVRNETSVYLSSGEVGSFSHRDTRFVLMGDVLYSIPSWSSLVRCKSLTPISETMTNKGIYITHFPIGSVDFAPSRESLSLDEQTFKKVSGRVTRDIIKYYRDLMKEVGKEENSSWYLFYHKFKNTPVWQVLSEYQLPFTKGYKLYQTQPDRYSYRGNFDGSKILFLSGRMKDVCGIVPAVKKGGDTVFSVGVEFLHQERVARMRNVVLAYSEREGGLSKKKDTLSNIATSFGDSNAVLYCHTKEILEFATKWFGVPEERVVCGDSYVPVKVKKPRQKGSPRGGFGTYEDHHTAAKVITTSGMEFCKVDLSDENLFYVDGHNISARGLNGDTHYLCGLDNAHKRFDKWSTLGVNKIIIVNKNNWAKIKRNKVKSLSLHLEGLVKKRQKSMIKHKVLADTSIYVGDKEKLIIHKVKSYKMFDRYKNSVAQDGVVESLLKLSSFGVSSSPKFKQELEKVTNMKTSVYNELKGIKENLPLWDRVKEEDLEYYLKLEKFIK